MTFDELQKTWQSQESRFKLCIDSDMLLKEIRRNKKYFESAIFWRDVREGGGAFLMFVFFLYSSLKYGVWSLLLLAISVLSIGVFLVADRIVQKRRRPELTESLMGCVKGSLDEVVHQIWLVKNVFWWYLLPPGIGIAIFIGHVAWLVRNSGWVGLTLIFLSAYSVSCVLLFWGVYCLNQKAVQTVELRNCIHLREIRAASKRR